MSDSTSHRHRGTTDKHGAHGGGGSDHGGEGGGGGGDGGGRLVKVGFGRTQPEAEMLQGILTEEGIPSVLKRTGGFDAPEFFGAGPHDVFVQAAIAQTARDLLAELMYDPGERELAELEEQARISRGDTGMPSPGRLALWVGAASLGAVILIWVLYQLSVS